MKSKNLTKTAGNLSIGIDLGGTKIATGLVNSIGKILRENRHPTRSPKHDEISVKEQIKFLIESMADSVLEIVQGQKGKTLKDKLGGIRGVGLASAGPLHVDKGILVSPFNFGDWNNVPIVKLLTSALAKRKLNFKVHFQNDAIAAALGEGWVGAAKNKVSYAMITLGTGVGTGVILNGKPSHSRGMGSEWGHMIVDRTVTMENVNDDIYFSTLEGLASGTGMLKRAKQLGFTGDSMTELADAAKSGDKVALGIFQRASEALAIGYYNLSIGYNLDIFAVSGGMLGIQELFVPQSIALYQKMMRDTFPEFEAPIVISKMGNKAGIVGAARLPFLI